MAEETTELKAVVTVETRAEAQIDRLEKKIKSLSGAANSTFAKPLDTTTKQAMLVSKAFDKYRGDLQDFGRAQRDWANGIYRQGRMTARMYNDLEKSVRGMVTAQGELRKGADETKFLRAVRTLNAYAAVWNRHHDTFMRNSRQQDALRAQIEDRRLYLAQRANQAIERGERRRADNAAALDRQRSRAFMSAERERESARQSLERQRSRAYIAQIRAEEAAGRQAEANKLREQLRAQREGEKLRRADERAKLKTATDQESARRALERQRSRAYIAQIREQERAGQKAEADRVREALRQQRGQESSRRALERQRSRAYIAEIREQERLGRKAEADKIREELRQSRSQESARRALERQRSQAYIKEIRDQERAGRKVEADKIREQLRQQRTQESSRRSLERQRSQAYLRELNEQAAAEAKNARYIQRLKNNSWMMQMRQDAQARRDQENHARATLRQFGVDGKQSLKGLGMAGGAIGSAFNRTGVIAMVGGAAAGAAAAAANRGLNSRMSVEAAETELMMFGSDPARPGVEAKKMSAADVADVRREWLDNASTDSGVSAATGLGVLTEVAKAGIDPEKRREMTELVLGASTGMDMNTRETTRVLGRMSTNMDGISPERMKKVMTGMAIAAAQTAADPDEIVSGMDRGMAALSYGMQPEDLAAWVAVGRSTGIQAAKTGNFIGTILQNSVGAKNQRGQRLKDLNEAGRMVGYGSARGLSRAAAADPNAFFEHMFEKVESMSTEKRARFSFLMGGNEWDDEILQMKQGLAKLKETRAAIKDERNANFLQDNKDLKNNSLRGLMARMRARFGILWETFGDGFTNTFEEVARWFISSGRAVNLGGLRTIGASLMTGLVNGLGFDNYTAMLNKYFGKGEFDWGEMNRKVEAFARGFGKGMLAVYETVQKMLGMIPGSDKMDAEAIGEMTAKLIGFALGVQAGRPAWDLLGIVKDGLVGLAAGVIFLNGALGMAGIGGIKGLGGKVLGGLGVRALGGVAGAAGSAAIGSALGSLGIGASLAATLAGGILIAGLAAGVAAIAVTIMNWGEIREWFAGTAPGRKLKGLDEYLREQAAKDPNASLATIFWKWMTGKDKEPDATVQKQSYSEEGGYRGMIHRASFNPAMDDLKRSIDKVGAKFELAALTGPGIAAGSGAMLGSTGGGGSYGLPQNSIPGGDAGQKYGKRFFSIPGGAGGAGGGSATSNPANSAASAAMLDAIAGTESGRAGYDAVLGNGKYGTPNKPVSTMTLDEAFAFGRQIKARHGSSSALGRYQIVGNTMRAAQQALGISGNAIFDQAMQDRMARWIARTQGLGAWEGLKHNPGAMAAARAALSQGGAKDVPGGNQTASIDPNGVAIPGLGSGKGQYEGLRVKSAEAVAGGASALGVTDLARQAQENLPGGVARFSAFNDAYHRRVNPRSLHTRGLAFDTSLMDPSKSREAAEAMRAKLRAAGLDESQFKVIDEYLSPSGHATGGHIHTQFNNKEAAQRYHDYVEGLKEKAKTAVAGKDAGDGFTSSGWKKDGWSQHNGGPWINSRTGEQASPEKAAELNKKMASWEERKRRAFGGGASDGSTRVDLTPFGRAYAAAKAAKAAAAAKAALGDGAKAPEAKKGLEEFGFTGAPFGSSPEMIAKARAALKGGAAATADGAPTAAERAIKNVPAPAAGGGQGGGGGGSSPQIHVTQHINGWEKSPKEIADMSQKHITEAWNHRAHDLEPELT